MNCREAVHHHNTHTDMLAVIFGVKIITCGIILCFNFVVVRPTKMI